MAHECIRAEKDTVLVDVLVVPNASRTTVVGVHGDRIKVRVAAAPEKGNANRAVERLLAVSTGAGRAAVVSGQTARIKTVRLWGVGVETVRACLVD
ncbi:MAG: DUF167 domain-containing protein [Acidimicrobiia bacterium]|nr:MAG: DUF167 domain-containing protein [Acidimicrobiia bacterium]